MKDDPDGRVMMHHEVSPANQGAFKGRLASAGCDLSRITFLDMQLHHRRLVLYREGTVVLDSYLAGDNTTTREALEMGRPVVTLPLRLLGGTVVAGVHEHHQTRGFHQGCVDCRHSRRVRESRGLTG